MIEHREEQKQETERKKRDFVRLQKIYSHANLKSGRNMGSRLMHTLEPTTMAGSQEMTGARPSDYNVTPAIEGSLSKNPSLPDIRSHQSK